MTIKVAVSGASGKTGSETLHRLLEKPSLFEAVAIVRSTTSKEKVKRLGLLDSNVHLVDVALEDAPAKLADALRGCRALVIATSAVPEVQVLSTMRSVISGYTSLAWQNLLRALQYPFAAATGRSSSSTSEGASAAAQQDGHMPPFLLSVHWKEGQTPEQVDYRGTLVQVDAARAAGVRHVVLISSMGGTNPNHFLNTLGAPPPPALGAQGEGGAPARYEPKAGGGGGADILNWKRAAEQYLVSCAPGLTYTILHPNHLIDAPGGRREFVLDVDDVLQAPHWRKRWKTPRADLAEFAVQCVLLALGDGGCGAPLTGPAADRSLDVTCKPPGEGGPAQKTTEDFRALLTSMNKNCSYSINNRVAPDAAWCRPKL